MKYLIITDDYRTPRLHTYEDWEAIGYPTKDIAVDTYVRKIKAERSDDLFRINRNMTRVASANRKIRLAEQLR